MQPWQPLLSGEDIFITVKGSYGVFLGARTTLVHVWKAQVLL